MSSGSLQEASGTHLSKSLATCSYMVKALHRRTSSAIEVIMSCPVIVSRATPLKRRATYPSFKVESGAPSCSRFGSSCHLSASAFSMRMLVQWLMLGLPMCVEHP